jgi:hypothetical protein
MVNPRATVPEGVTGVDQVIDVTFDASVVTQPGDYLATLKITTDTPYPDLSVPVTMTVEPPATFGKLEGTVTGLGYCDADPAVLEGAVVDIMASGGMTWTLETDEFGYYSLWLDEAGTPFTVQVSYPEHEVGLASGVVVEDENYDWTSIRWLVPCG